MSFFLIKLLQTVDSIKLDLDSQSPESRVPESWKTRSGRAGIEKFNPRSHLTMYAHVSGFGCSLSQTSELTPNAGWAVGEDDGGGSCVICQFGAKCTNYVDATIYLNY